PVMFELGARPHPPRELYRAYLAQSDVFIGLYWQRYGWIGPGMDISGLEDEFRLSEGMPRLLYLKTPGEQEPRLGAMIADLPAGGGDLYRSCRPRVPLRRRHPRRQRSTAPPRVARCRRRRRRWSVPRTTSRRCRRWSSH